MLNVLLHYTSTQWVYVIDALINEVILDGLLSNTWNIIVADVYKMSMNEQNISDYSRLLLFSYRRLGNDTITFRYQG